MKVVKNVLFITLPFLFLLLVISELVLRKWFPVMDPYERFKNRQDKSYIPSQMPANTRYVFRSRENLPGMDSVMKYTTNNLGFRGDYLAISKPSNEFRIFLVGGSTTQCLYIDDAKSLDRVVQNELQNKVAGKVIKVYNVGRTGEATPEHVAVLTQKLIHLQPDLVIVFSGLNDFRRSVVNYDYSHLTPMTLYTPSYVFLMATELQIFRRLYYLFKIRRVEEIQEAIPFETNYRELFRIQQQTPVSDSIPRQDAKPYAINLATIAGACKENGVKLIFMTNQTTWNSSIDSRSKYSHFMLTIGKICYREEYLDAGMKVFNDTMRNVASRIGIPILDLPREIPKTQDYFYDDCHFNIQGASVAGKKLAQLINERGLLTP